MQAVSPVGCDKRVVVRLPARFAINETQSRLAEREMYEQTECGDRWAYKIPANVPAATDCKLASLHCGQGRFPAAENLQCVLVTLSIDWL